MCFHSSINLSFSLFHCHYQFLFSTVIFKIALSLSLSLSYKLPISCSNRTPLSVAAMPRVKEPTKDAKRFDSYKVEEKYEEFIKPHTKFYKRRVLKFLNNPLAQSAPFTQPLQRETGSNSVHTLKDR